jgi:FkbM family methyltransferase
MTSNVAKLRGWWRNSFAGAAARGLINMLPRNTVLPILKGPLRGKKWVIGSSFQSCWLGVYEYEKQQEFIGTVKAGDVVYDVGANVGFYTLLASTLTGPSGRVFSFEPLPRNLALLKRHVEMNQMSNVEILDGAVSDKSGTARFSTGDIPEMTHLSATGEIEVQTYQLDELVSRGRLPPPWVMKIDVEGAETAVLSGAREILQRHKPILLLATHGADVHRKCCDMLREMRYTLRPMDGKPLEESSEVRADPPASI